MHNREEIEIELVCYIIGTNQKGVCESSRESAFGKIKK
jgi:hypothetical protein